MDRLPSSQPMCQARNEVLDLLGVRIAWRPRLEIEFSDGTIGVRDFADILKEHWTMRRAAEGHGLFSTYIEDGALTSPTQRLRLRTNRAA